MSHFTKRRRFFLYNSICYQLMYLCFGLGFGFYCVIIYLNEIYIYTKESSISPKGG